MPVRSTMSDLIARTRLLIADPAGASQQFADQDIQNWLDANRDDIRYESLVIAPSIVNTASTNNQAATIFADYYSRYGWWESDVTLQAYVNGQAWVVATPLASELLIDQAHWQFELNVYTSGTVPGQLPPVFATGKIYDVYAAAADLLEFWAAVFAGAYDVNVDGQSLRRSQLMTAKHALAEVYRRRARPKLAKMVREDVHAPISSKRMRLLEGDDLVKGA